MRGHHLDLLVCILNCVKITLLDKDDQLLQRVEKFKYLWLENLPQEFLLKPSPINVKFLENKTVESTAGLCLILMAETINCVQ